MGKKLSVTGSLYTMEDERVKEQYRAMYRAMIEQDISKLEQLLDKSFVLVHMTGMQQNKEKFLNAVQNGTLRYFSASHENISTRIDETTATLVGQSLVRAAVFGGGEHLWRLQQTLTMKKANDCWLIAKSVASTY